MKKLFFSLLFAPLSLVAISVPCASNTFQDCMNMRDFEAVQEFVNSKRTIFLAEKLDCLSIAGNVKVDILNRNSYLGSLDVFGGTRREASTGLPLGHLTFETELNLMVNYKSKDGKTWAKTRFQLDEAWGIFERPKECKTSVEKNGDPGGLFGSGECQSFDIKWAYWGWRVYETCDHDFEINLLVGRNKLYKAFNSRIEFSSTADGGMLEFKRFMEPDWLLYNKTMFFVVDQRTNHWAWVTEFGTLDFMESKFDLTYSFIDWALNGRSQCGTEDPLGSLFRVSQWAPAYNFTEDGPFGVDARFYSGIVVNHAARSIILNGENKGRQNLAWYAGFLIGGPVKKAGDWMFDAMYQWVEAMAIPSKDVFGIGRGVEFRSAPSINGYGKGNFKGFQLEALVALTDKCQIDATYTMSWTLDPTIGLIDPATLAPPVAAVPGITGSLNYNKFEIDFIVNF